ncbi:alpha-glucan water dikinase 1 [Citrus sinensis]|uniref:Alpha-glucan water dikinase 1 n=1 Tax=Citrus sinensis TaxID=2711 RepID=A0ACB8LJD5_CITSI|nr:alpha-glucan water dikinase 1 [Citrus sinensis]
MSNSIGRNVLHQSLLCSTVFEHQSKRHSSGIPANSLFQAVSINQPAGASAARKSPLSTKFYGTSLNARPKMAMGRHRPVLITPRAVLAVDSASELAGKFNLEGNVELQVTVGAPTPGSLTQVNIEISYSSNSLLLHWGAIRDKKEKWVLPSRQPDGTKNYKNRALRTPFVSEEYEAARTELLEEIVRGTSVEDLRAKLTNKNDRQEIKESSSHGTKNAIPDDLVQIQSYIRWERAGKPNYSADQQLVNYISFANCFQQLLFYYKREFEEARKELQSELEKGISLDEIRKKITKGEIQTKVSDQLKTKKYFRTERIQRKQRDFMQILNKHVAEPTEKKNISVEPKALTPVELFVKPTEEQEGDSILNKKIYKLADKELLVFAHKPGGKTKIHLATDFKEPLFLHWALSKKAGEWLAPPPSVMPAGSVSLSGAVETKFTTSSLADLPYQVQSIEIEIEEEGYVGMPFVLQSGGNWIKNKGSDFYVDFSYESKQVQQDFGDGKGTAKALLEKIAGLEIEAQKSFMHRFNIAADLIQEAKEAGELGFAGILVWMSEISKAQDRLTDLLQNVYISNPECREIVRMILSTVGRGGEGDVGQRIRDEILVIQRNNNCKGGMMEEWHQKLHNNTSPDDVIICQALIDYIKSDFNISAYWKTLNDNGITKERLLSYDRAIHSEPNFRRDQKDGLLRDLGNYMRTLKAVHSGADLESAITNCLGYRSEGQGFMVGVQINPIPNLPSGFPELLQFVSEHVEDRNVEALLEGLLEARQEIRPLLFKHNDRLKDLLFLDIALESSVRTAIERGYEELNEAGPEKIMYFVSLILENLALSSDDNEDLIYCLKGWSNALSMSKSKSDNWALFAKSVLDRTRLALASKADWYQKVLQPSAEYLGTLLSVDKWAVDIFTEEMIRAGSAAALSLLLNRLDPVLRKTASLGSWQVISPVEVFGYVAVVDELLAVQDKSYDQPTILLARRVKGEEEIPHGTVAVLTADMPDVLSHVSVRARNCKVCFATCFDPNILADLQSNEGKMLHLKPTSADIAYSVVEGSELQDSSSANLKEEDGPSSSVALVKKQFAGRYAITSDEFTGELVKLQNYIYLFIFHVEGSVLFVGAKSRNIAYLKGKVQSWIGIPTSVALPFGVFEKAVAEKLQILKQKLGEEDHSALREIRETVLQMKAPNQLVQELKTEMKSSGMPWPGDEGEQRWEQAWMAIKKEIINADYAFVIHTTNPSSGDSSEIYAEVVKGLGETLVGAYPGRALSFVCKKNDLKSPRVLGYPSKPIGLFIRRSIIFRSDSNGEDLEGYAGAGLYDSVPMDEAETVVLDYSSDRLITDGHFQQSILSSIARSGCEIEELFGSAQDIEGVVRDGKIYVVQTRPQM